MMNKNPQRRDKRKESQGERRRTIFDRRLYREGMRQLAVAGIISLIVFSIQVILLVIQDVILNQWSLVDLNEMNPFSYLTFCLVAPLMMIYLFRFTTSRSSSDFYHSIPQTRLCLGLSFTAAVLSWSLIVQWGSTLLALILHLAMPKLYTVQTGLALTESLMVSSGVLLVAGAVFLGISLTGTLFTNFAASLIILFFPRFVMFAMQNTLQSSIAVMTTDSVPLIGNHLNFVTSLIFSPLETTSYSYSQMISLPAGIYTAVLGAIYLCLGLLAFSRRPSETAGKPAVSPVWQTVFRLVPAALVCVFPAVILYRVMTGLESMDSNTWFQLVVIYLIAAGLYFLYELITTRRLKSLRGALPGLAILVLLNVVFLTGMISVRRSVLSFQPDTDDIESVKFASESAWVSLRTIGKNDDSSILMPGYLSTRASRIPVTESAARQLVAERLKENIADDPELQKSDKYPAAQEVTIRSAGRNYSRKIYLTTKDLETLAEAFAGNSQMQDIYMNLPAASDPKLSVYCGTGYNSGEALTDAENRQIYEALREDARNMGFRDWYLLTRSDYLTGGNNNCPVSLYIVYRDGGKMTGCVIPIVTKLPRTLAVYLQIAQSRQQRMYSSFLQQLQDIQKGKGRKVDTSSAYCEIDLIASEAQGSGSQSYTIDLSTPAQLNALVHIMEKYKDTTIDSAKGYAMLTLTLTYQDEETVSSEDPYIAGESTEAESSTDAWKTDYSMDGSLCLPMPDVSECRLFQNLNDVGQSVDGESEGELSSASAENDAGTEAESAAASSSEDALGSSEESSQDPLAEGSAE